MKIYDCSNTSKRPVNRGYGGPVENSVVTLLKQEAHQHGTEFVSTPEDADILFTNDVYPEELLKLDKRRVKRMDGIFWQKSLTERNIALNKAALESDFVVFISEYSRNSLRNLYGIKCRHERVILNAVDEKTFYPEWHRTPEHPVIWVAAATHWGRKEKRFNDIICFAKLIEAQQGSLLLVGTVPKGVELPDNVLPLGYIERPKVWARVLRRSDAMVNFSYRDAAPKVVAEGTACGLPVLYADSGGVSELVCAGVPIRDTDVTSYEAATPALDKVDMENGLTRFGDDFSKLKHVAQGRAPNSHGMTDEYFSIFKEVLA